MRSPADALLYGIIDLSYVSPENAADILEKLIAGGIDMAQLRGKKHSIDELSLLAEKLLRLTTAAEIPLIANDYAQIAQRVNVQGIHVGQDDESIETVREQVERPIIVGKSTHSVEQATAAGREGADYIGLGPIFPTPTKPDYPSIGLSQIHEIRKSVSLPIFCIGGIKLENLPQIIASGANRAVIVSGLLQANDVVRYASACKKLLVTAIDRQSTIRNPQ